MEDCELTDRELPYRELPDRELPDREVLDRSVRLFRGSGIDSGGGDPKEEGPYSTPVYYHERGELFAKDVERQLAVLP